MGMYGDIKKNLKESWFTFRYTSGGNPYIAKSEKERDRLLKKYKGKVKQTGPESYTVDDKEPEWGPPADLDLDKELKEEEFQGDPNDDPDWHPESRRPDKDAADVVWPPDDKLYMQWRDPDGKPYPYKITVADYKKLSIDDKMALDDKIKKEYGPIGSSGIDMSKVRAVKRPIKEGTLYSSFDKDFFKPEEKSVEVKHFKPEPKKVSGDKVTTEDLNGPGVNFKIDNNGEVNYLTAFWSSNEPFPGEDWAEEKAEWENPDDVWGIYFEIYDENGSEVDGGELLTYDEEEWDAKQLCNDMLGLCGREVNPSAIEHLPNGSYEDVIQFNESAKLKEAGRKKTDYEKTVKRDEQEGRKPIKIDKLPEDMKKDYSNADFALYYSDAVCGDGKSCFTEFFTNDGRSIGGSFYEYKKDLNESEEIVLSDDYSKAYEELQEMVSGIDDAEVALEDIGFKELTNELIDLINSKHFKGVNEVVEFIIFSDEVDALRDSVDLEESALKEADQVSACRNAIEKAKAKLKRSKFGENFGQSEVRKIKDKFDDLSYSEENKKIKDLINDFDDWCSNYVPMRESQKLKESSDLERLVRKEFASGKAPDEIQYKGKTYKAFNVMDMGTASDSSLIYYCNMENTPSGDPQESNDYFMVNTKLKLNPSGNGFKGVKEINYIDDLTESQKLKESSNVIWSSENSEDDYDPEELKEMYNEYLEGFEDKEDAKDFEDWKMDYIYLDDGMRDIKVDDLDYNIKPLIDGQINNGILIVSGDYNSSYPDFRPSGAGGKLLNSADDLIDWLSDEDRVDFLNNDGVLGVAGYDHDGSISGNLYTLPDDPAVLLQVAKATDYYGQDDSDEDILEEFKYDVTHDYYDMRDFFPVADKFIPIKVNK